MTIVNVSFQQRLDQTNAVLTMIYDINSNEMTSKQVGDEKGWKENLLRIRLIINDNAYEK